MTKKETFKNSSPRIQRILAMLLDHIIMCVLIVPLFLIIFSFSKQPSPTFGSIGFYFILLIYYNKDFFRGKSTAKRIIGYQVIDNSTKKTANELQCFIRNLTIIFWPIEVIVGLISPERRIGDFIANTRVIVSEKEKLTTIWEDFKNIQLKMNFFIILAIAIIYFYGLNYLFSI